MGQQRAASAIWRDQNKPISRASDELWDSRCNKTCYAAQRQRHELTSGIHKISIYSPGLTNPCNSMGQLQDLPVMGWLCIKNKERLMTTKSAICIVDNATQVGLCGTKRMLMGLALGSAMLLAGHDAT